jgi:heme/copper-type cytochrome/quinol oxidase subunit 3
MTTRYPTAQEITPEQRLANNRLGITLTIVVLALVFACLIYANFMVRNAQNQWPPPGVNRMDMVTPVLMTTLLLLSSGAMIIANRAFRRADSARFTLGLGAAWLLGAAYSVWMFGTLARILAAFNGVYSAMFLALWFVHVAHTVAVLLFLGYVINKARQGVYTANGVFYPVEAVSNLWHFLTIVWVVLFVTLYII